MASKDKVSREEQKTRLDQQLAKRIAILKERGKSDSEIAKDSIIRKLKAQQRETHNRLSSIDRKKELIENVKKMTLEKAAVPKSERKAQKKDAEQSDEPKKEKKAKKKAQQKEG